MFVKWIVRNRTVRGSVRRFMDDPSTLRQKAAHFFQKAASAATCEKAEKLREVGRQLEVWADDLEGVETARPKKSKLGMERASDDDSG
jgi:hypothetical protein